MRSVIRVLVAAVFLAASPAFAEEADELYRQAIELYQGGQYLEAADALERAYQLDPDAALAFNTARAYENGGNLALAKRWYLEALSLGGLEGSDRERAAQALERIENLESSAANETPNEGYLQIFASPRAQVLIDGQNAGESPFSKALPPGTYTVRLQAEGYRPHAEIVELSRGQTVTVTASLDRSGLMTWVYVSGGVALLSLGVGLTGDLLAVAAYDDAQNARDKESQLADFKSRGEAMRVVAICGYSLASVAAITSLVLFFVDDSDESGYEGFTLAPTLDTPGFALGFVF